MGVIVISIWGLIYNFKIFCFLLVLWGQRIKTQDYTLNRGRVLGGKFTIPLNKWVVCLPKGGLGVFLVVGYNKF